MGMPRFFSPLGLSSLTAKIQTRTLAVGAHPDDLEFMCLAPIFEGQAKQSFGGLIVTTGSGSLRSPAHKNLTPEEFSALRWKEQMQAALAGDYAFVDCLGYESAAIKEAQGFEKLVDALQQRLGEFTLEALYTHQPFDRHASHVRVSLAVLEALRRLPQNKRPQKLYGCEVWGGLDWVPKSVKVFKPLSTETLLLQKKLAGLFASQAGPGAAKNYVEALVGRKTAHAVFQEATGADPAIAQEIYMDLSSWMNSTLSWSELAAQLFNKFQSESCRHWPTL